MPDPTLPAAFEVVPGEVHVVRILLDGPADASVLDEDERARAGRFYFDRDRRRFVAAHGWLRVALGRCLDRPPESLRFVAGPYGKPRLVDPPVDLRFNLSHGGERALLAVTLGREVGVDVEEERDIEDLAIADRFFCAAEAASLRALPEVDQRAAFFRCWTRKESFIKAVGEGLTFPLDAFEVSLAPEADATQVLRACQARGQALERWRVVPLPIDNGYAAAVAAEAGDWRVVRWNAVGR